MIIFIYRFQICMHRIFLLFQDMYNQNSKKNLSLTKHTLPAESNKTKLSLSLCLLISTFSRNKCPFLDLFSTTFFILCFMLITSLLKCPSSIVLKCWIVFQSTRRWWCALGRIDKLHSSMSYNASLTVSSMLINWQNIVNNVSSNKNKIIYWLIDEMF